jgi:signal transduction histidine kinase
MAESLERGKVADSSKQQEYFRFIGQECRRLSSLIENVLDFSRIDQGRKQYEFEPTDLVALTRQTVKLMETYAAERQIQLQLQLPDPQPATCDLQPSVDGRAIQQALINLIDNAIKHSPKGDTVRVGLEVRSAECGVGSVNAEARRAKCEAGNTTLDSMQDASRIALWVEDNGEGIPPAEHEKIFERFYRVGSELRRETQGVGIGLSLVKHAVEAHGGRVLVRSAPGQGSRFTIELPAPPLDTKSEVRNPKSE